MPTEEDSIEKRSDARTYCIRSHRATADTWFDIWIGRTYIMPTEEDTLAKRSDASKLRMKFWGGYSLLIWMGRTYLHHAHWGGSWVIYSRWGWGYSYKLEYFDVACGVKGRVTYVNTNKERKIVLEIQISYCHVKLKYSHDDHFSWEDEGDWMKVGVCVARHVQQPFDEILLQNYRFFWASTHSGCTR